MKNYKMKLANKEFRKRLFSNIKSVDKKVSAIIPREFILNNPVFCDIITEFTAHFRLINLRMPIENFASVQRFFIDLFIPKISEILSQLDLIASQKTEIIELCKSVMNKITLDTEANATWGTACMVEYYRNISLLNFIQANFFVIPHPYRAAYLKAILYKKYIKSENENEINKLIRDDTLKFRNQIAEFHLDLEIKNTKIYDNLKTFLIFIVSISVALNNVFNPKLESIGIIGVGALIIFLIYSYLKVSCISCKPLKEFRPKNLPPQLRASLLTEVFENLIEQPHQTPQSMKGKINMLVEDCKTFSKSIDTFETKDLKCQPLSPIKPKKLKIKTRRHHADFFEQYEDSKNNNNNKINLLLMSAGLTLLKIVWKTQLYGIVEFISGRGDTFQLWSKNKRLEQALKLFFVHFPKRELEKQYGEEIVAAFRQVAEIAQFVTPKGHTGYVSISGNEFKMFKIKAFTKLLKNKRMLVVADKQAEVLLAPDAYKRNQLFFATEIIDKSAESIKKNRLLYNA